MLNTSIADIERVQDALFRRLYEDLENADEHDYYLTGKDIYQYTYAIKNLEDFKKNAKVE